MKYVIAAFALFVLGIVALFAWAMTLPAPGRGELVSVEVINGSTPEGAPQAYIRATIRFTALPEDPAMVTPDITFVASSTALMDDVAFTWADVANADKDDTTVATSPPPLNQDIVFDYVIEQNLRENITVSGNTVSLRLRMKWNDRSLDSETIDITGLYEF